MFKRLLYMLPFVLIGTLIGYTVVEAQDDPQPGHDPYTSEVGIYLQSYNNDTVGRISCPWISASLNAPNGDATLFVENQPPKSIVCFITIKKVVEG